MREITFEEFLNNLAKGIEENLPEELKNAKVEIQTITKNNGTKLTAINIRLENENMTPTIYVSEYYKDYINNKKEMEEIIKEVINLRQKHRKPNMDLNWLEDFYKVKDKIIPTFIGLEENNKEIMDMCPYVKILDMVMVFRIEIDITEDNQKGTVIIKRDLQDKLGVTTDTLFETALKNIKEKKSLQIKSMKEVMMEMIGADSFEAGIMDNNPMYIISNKEMVFGSYALIDEEFMWDVYDKLGDDFIIIPSSIHELIVIPMKELEMNHDYVNKIIKDVNRTQLDKKDVLSNHAYKFTKSEGLESI